MKKSTVIRLKPPPPPPPPPEPPPPRERPPTPVSAMHIRDAFGYLTLGEFNLLKRTAASLSSHPTIVNIGAGQGTSGLLFLETRMDATLYTVDIQAEPNPNGSLFAERLAIEDAYLDALEGTRWNQVHGDSVEVGKTWEIETNLVFVDGDHGYMGCYGDCEEWDRTLTVGGFMAIHDYGLRKRFPGVLLAVDDFFYVDNASRYEFVEQADTLIVFRKTAMREHNRD